MLNDTQIAIGRQILNLGGKLDSKLANMFIDEVEALQQQNKQLKDCVDWYADEVNYSPFFGGDARFDRGERARETLKSIHGGTSDERTNHTR